MENESLDKTIEMMELLTQEMISQYRDTISDGYVPITAEDISLIVSALADLVVAKTKLKITAKGEEVIEKYADWIND